MYLPVNKLLASLTNNSPITHLLRLVKSLEIGQGPSASTPVRAIRKGGSPKQPFLEGGSMKALWPFRRFSAAAFRVYLRFIVTFCGFLPMAAPASQSAHVDSLVTQEFLCYPGLDHNDCLQDLAKLQALLGGYSAYLPRHWTWVIVASEDWSWMVEKLQVNSGSPAFTDIKAHQTFLEGALFLPKPPRTDELAASLGVPVDELLPVAVSHELGHAICHGRDESVAKRVSSQLRSGRTVDCTNSLTTFDELYVRSRSPHLGSR
jgi:hypothetical protein